MSRGAYRPIYAALVDGPDFQALTPAARLTLFVLKVTLGSAGIDVQPGLVPSLQDRTGLGAAEAAEAIAELEAAGWIQRDQNIVWLVRGLEFEPQLSAQNVNHRLALQRHIASLPRRPIVKRFMARYRAWFIQDRKRKRDTALGHHTHSHSHTGTHTHSHADSHADAYGDQKKEDRRNKKQDTPCPPFPPAGGPATPSHTPATPGPAVAMPPVLAGAPEELPPDEIEALRAKAAELKRAFLAAAAATTPAGMPEMRLAAPPAVDRPPSKGGIASASDPPPNGLPGPLPAVSPDHA